MFAREVRPLGLPSPVSRCPLSGDAARTGTGRKGRKAGCLLLPGAGRFLPVSYPCQLRPIAATAGLQARCPPQRVVDSFLPTRPILLKMRNQIAVELDRHQFFRDGNVPLSLHADRCGRCRRRWFERSFGCGQGVGRSIPNRWSCHANFSRRASNRYRLDAPVRSMENKSKSGDGLYRGASRS